ncbi:Rho termination factor N-terminal domain-containing protein [Bacillus sp. JJ1773]|uniref:Rho termination factor N-terminal domain-containing protein n=1 Tax=Bacillus sp. JJ1773 TaxID=3122965 RepID=UPI0030002F77
MMLLKAIEPIFLNGRIVEPEETFSCHTDFAKKLSESGSAELIETENEISVETSKTVTKKFLDSKTKDELLDYARSEGIEGISDSNKKGEIIDAILKVVG